MDKMFKTILPALNRVWWIVSIPWFILVLAIITIPHLYSPISDYEIEILKTADRELRAYEYVYPGVPITIILKARTQEAALLKSRYLSCNRKGWYLSEEVREIQNDGIGGSHWCAVMKFDISKALAISAQKEIQAMLKAVSRTCK